MDETKWLDHLKGVVPSAGYGNRMSMYLIALEAWRRGLNIKFYKADSPENKMFIRYIISDDLNEHRFESSLGDKLTDSAYQTCENKDITKKVLSSRGITVPQGLAFQANDEVEDIINYAKTLRFPVVVKPIAENAGKGVFPNILSAEKLTRVIEHVREELGYEDIIIEKHFHGTEYRILIVDGRIVGAVNRRPANVKGDGKNTIAELINQKNASKINNPIISTKTIEIDNEVMDNLSSYNLTLESIPPKGKLIYVRNKSNVSRGGDPIDVTDQLTDEMKDIAIKSVQAIKGLDICGLDMLVNEEDGSCTVLEINTKPMIGLHMYPIQGQARDVVSPIVDYYFPQSKHTERSNLYFDFESAILPIRQYLTAEIKLTSLDAPEPLNANQFNIKGQKLNSEFRSTVRRKALELGINGRLEELRHDKKATLILATNDEKKLKTFLEHLKGLTEKYLITNIQKLKWNQSVNVGFHTLSISNTRLTLQNLNKELRSQKKYVEQNKVKIDKLNLDKQNLKNEIMSKNNSIIRLDREKQQLTQKEIELLQSLNGIYSSRSWNVTRPLRRFVAKRQLK